MLATTRERERESNTLILASNADVQKQIESLKQENELLELQQKNEALKRRESSAEIAEQIEAIKAENEALKAKKAENNTIIKKGFLGFCRGKYSATGCFIGGELGLAITDNWFWLDYGMFSFVSSGSLSKNKTSAAIPINLIFGYQWYYMQSQGIRIKANVGYANYNVDYLLEFNNNNTSEEIKFSFENHALQYGLELAWLWDFVRKGKHTLGIDLGTGFEGSTFFQTIKENEEKYHTTTAFSWVGRLGLHYYFNVNHQIGLAYSYKSYTAVEAKAIQNKGIPFGKVVASPRNQILLSYAYKF